ncbi:hypothetical protein TELCIR_04155 [Teladorsagia circumcincta]|uniref:Uncharacterized protein n=1 Tax=Teladorsagia circumcincta TaxID=45464 RepID=A0A2G9UWI2_TELCI|nr:hypothetical protein TELCIR_04155 [Teladorsagia circumcincta]
MLTKTAVAKVVWSEESKFLLFGTDEIKFVQHQYQIPSRASATDCEEWQLCGDGLLLLLGPAPIAMESRGLDGLQKKRLMKFALKSKAFDDQDILNTYKAVASTPLGEGNQSSYNNLANDRVSLFWRAFRHGLQADAKKLRNVVQKYLMSNDAPSYAKSVTPPAGLNSYEP